MTNPKWHTVLYVGMSCSLEGRVFDHKNKQVEGFTKKYNLTKLVYYEYCGDPYAAACREKQIKKWRREKKIILIESINPDWRDLADDLL